MRRGSGMPDWNRRGGCRRRWGSRSVTSGADRRGGFVVDPCEQRPGGWMSGAPEGGAASEAEGGEGADAGERGELVAGQVGAGDEVGDRGERTLGARGHDRVRGGFAEAGDVAQAEADGIRAG